MHDRTIKFIDAGFEYTDNGNHPGGNGSVSATAQYHTFVAHTKLQMAGGKRTDDGCRAIIFCEVSAFKDLLGL